MNSRRDQLHPRQLEGSDGLDRGEERAEQDLWREQQV